MDNFQIEILEDALKRVQSASDASSLARMFMKLTASPTHKTDATWEYSEELVMAFLIEREIKTAEPSFSNIRLALESGDEIVAVLKKDLESVASVCTDNYLRLTLTGLHTRLANFRRCSA